MRMRNQIFCVVIDFCFLIQTDGGIRDPSKDEIKDCHGSFTMVYHYIYHLHIVVLLSILGIVDMTLVVN